MKRFFSRLHLWLSLPFGIIITLMCFSGAMLVFETEISEWLRPELYKVERVSERRLPVGELAARVSQTLPDSVQVTGVTLSADPRETVRVSLSKPRRASVAVNPYTGEVVGRVERLPFFATMFSLHRWLLGKPTASDGSMGWGKIVTGVSTLAFVFVLLSGIVAWWPRRRRGWADTLRFRWHANPFMRWFHLHRWAGVWTAVLLLTMCLTGLMWSFKWYNRGVYALLGVEQPQQGGPGGGSDAKRTPREEPRGGKGGGEGREARAEGRHGGRNGKPADGKPGERRAPEGKARPADGEGEKPSTDFSCWQRVADELARRTPDYRSITLRDGKATVSVQPLGNSRASDSYEFDAHTGRITSATPYAEAQAAGKVRGWQFSLHTGTWGGLVTRILYLLAALLGATLPLTGYYIWWRKRHPLHRH